MADISETVQTSRGILYLAIFVGVLILVFVIVGNQSQNNPENLAETPDPTPTAARDPNNFASNGTPTSAAANGTPTSAVSPADPFKAFLEAHKNAQPSPADSQPLQKNPQTQQEIQDRFKEAIRNQQVLSTANPFAPVSSPASSGVSR